MKKLGLFIGIDDYEEFSPLRGAANDANSMAGLFEHRLGFETRVVTHQHLMRGTSIQTTIRSMVSGLAEGDIFVFFFAGHGKSPLLLPGETRDQLLILPDVARKALEEGRKEGTIGMLWVQSVTEKKGLQRAFIIDACRAPLVIEDKDVRDGEANFKFDGEVVYRDMVLRRQRPGIVDSPLVVFNSCQDKQRAIELRGKDQGLFTSSVISVVKACIDSNKPVRIDASFEDAVAKQMLVSAMEHGIPDAQQRPFRDGVELCLFDANDRHHREQRQLLESFENQLARGALDDPLGDCARDSLGRLTAMNLASVQLQPLRQRYSEALAERQVKLDQGFDARVIELARKINNMSSWLNYLSNSRLHEHDAEAHQAMKDLDAAADNAQRVQQRLDEERIRVAVLNELAIYRFRKLEALLQVAGCEACGEMARIEAGSFMMGAAESETEARFDEKPRHRVNLKSFEIGRTVVTQGQWKAVMGNNPSFFKGAGDARPVECISWNDTQEFLKKLNAKTGQTYRLPTEAEWEYAARAGSDTAFWWGNSIKPEQANYDGRETYNDGVKGDFRDATVRAESFGPNPWGLYNVHGNVWEWVQDAFHNSYKGAPEDDRAWEEGYYEKHDTGVARRVLRGGCWLNDPMWLRSACRKGNSPDDRGSYIGFRIARTLDNSLVQDAISVSAKKLPEELADSQFRKLESLQKQSLADALAEFKVRLVEVRAIEDLQHRVQVQREAAVLVAQRIEVLSTKPWRDAQAAQEALSADVASWQTEAAALTGDANWPSVDTKFPPQLLASQAQLGLVWDAFQDALRLALQASEDASAALPNVLVWADELRAARGLPLEGVPKPVKPKIDPEIKARATQAVRDVLTKLEQEVAQGHGKASAGAASALRNALKEYGRLIDDKLESQAHVALIAADELEGWQRWVDQLRDELVVKAEGLLNHPESQAIGGSKMQETLRNLREQWKTTDKAGEPNHGLWKRFDDACNEAQKVVEEREKAQSALGERDRIVLDASKALQVVNASGDVQAIRLAMAALDAALPGQAQALAAVAATVEESDQKEAPAVVPPALEATDSEVTEAAAQTSAEPAAEPDAPVVVRKPVVAMSGDDCHEQAHGEPLTYLLCAWKLRDGAQVPSLQDLGNRVTPAMRNAWIKALGQAPTDTAGTALLRLEMAAELPTPADHLSARRLLQLQLLTRRHDPPPAQTWGQDTASVLASAFDATLTRRLQNVLKVLLKP